MGCVNAHAAVQVAGWQTAVEIGSGDYRYRIVTDWARLPPGLALAEVAGVAVDRQDRVFVFQRGTPPMLVLDRGGGFLRAWGEGLFERPHGIHIGPDEAVYCTDDLGHTVTKCSPEGAVLLRIGVPGAAAEAMSGRPFHQCTHTALSPQGEIYVSDGYGNARVHKFAPDGRHLLSWGQPGCLPGELNLPHNICCDADGWVYVADRENHRIQVFDGQGRFETQWHGVHRPCGLCLGPGGCPCCYVAELGPALGANRRFTNLGPRVSVLSLTGELLARVGDRPCGLEADQFVAPHGIAVDSRGNLYVGEVAHTTWPILYPGQPRPPTLTTLRKLVRL